MVIFHNYVSLPEGTSGTFKSIAKNNDFPNLKMAKIYLQHVRSAPQVLRYIYTFIGYFSGFL